MTSNIVLRSFQSHNVRIRQEDRYVSLTDMAKASGKLLADWTRLKKTESYLNTLSAVMGIPITGLIEVFQGGVPELQGSWGHPKVSLRFAQWCSDEFAVQVDFWMDELLTTGSVELRPGSIDRKTEILADIEIARAAIAGFKAEGIDGLLAEAHALTLCAAKHPDIQWIVEGAKQLLPQQERLQVESYLMIPKDIGQRFDPPLSSQKINKLLIELDLQVKTDSKDLPYRLTEKGQEHGRIILNQGSHSAKTVQQVRWKESVIDLIDRHLQSVEV